MNAITAIKRYTTIDFNLFKASALTGIAGGVAAGAFSRFSMRMVAVLGGLEPSFSIGGTLAILLVGAFFGIPFALIYTGIGRFLPFPDRWKGLAYGVILGVLFIVLPFLLIDDGELTLVSPWTGILLFFPLPVIFGVLQTLLLPKLEGHYTDQTEGRLSLPGLVLLGAGLIFSISGTADLYSQFPLIPETVRDLAQASGMGAQTLIRFINGLTVSFILIYTGLVVAIFWKGAHHWMSRFASLALLAFGGAFMTRGLLPGESMNALPLVRLFPILMRTFGLGSLLVLLFIFPDGRFESKWTRWLASIWVVWLLVWFAGLLRNTSLDPNSWSTLTYILVILAGLASAALAQIARYRTSDRIVKERIRSVLLALIATLAMVTLLGLGMAIPYLLPWLLIPAALLYAILRKGLWGGQTRE